jgi:4a-hydroxytetrahydrobiopterin dehydratase
MLTYMAKVEKMQNADIETRLAGLPGWGRQGDAISRRFTFSGFADAVAFVVRLGFEAESVDHHPDLLINYKRVMVTYSTHSAGGLTVKDFEGAAAANRLAAATASGER